MDYSAYRELKIRRLEPGVLEIVMGEEGGKLPVATARMHAELARIWLDVDLDRDVRVAILRGAGKGFSAGGDLAMVEEMTRDFAVRARIWREARDLVYNLINCSKMVVSAMHGPAVGAGLVAGLLADISIAAKNASLIDGHTRLGAAARDDAAIVWPLPCGIAKDKYYRRADGGPARGYLDRGEEREAHRRPHAPGRGGRRPRGHRLAAALRHGEGEVLPAAVRGDQRRGGRAAGARFAHLRGSRAAGEGARSGAQARCRRANGVALDQVLAQQLAAHGRPDVRRLARARSARLHRPRGKGRRCFAPREEKAEFPARA